MHCPEHAEAEILKLREAGIEPTLDELAELFELAKRVEEPFAETNPLASRAPLAVGTSGLYLYPLTLQATAWMELHCEAFADMRILLVCYAAHVGRVPGAFDQLHGYKGILTAITDWGQTVTATATELASAEEILTGGNEPEHFAAPTQSETLTMCDILASLAVESGQPVEYWLTHTSEEMLAALNALARKQCAESGTGAPTDPGAASRMQDLMWCVQRIRERAANGA